METQTRISVLTLSAILVTAAIAVVALAGGRSTLVAASTDLDPEEAAFMQILNDYRAQNGLGPILIDPSLQAAAEWMSTDMGVNNYFSHTDSTGGSPWDRMCDHGYCYNTWKGENLAAGYSTAAAVFEGWKGSPGHHANMLGEHYVVMGIALVHTPGSDFGYYWTNDFGGHDPNPSPPPAPTNTPTPSASPSPTPTPTPTAAPTASPAPSPTPKATASASPSPTASPSPIPGLLAADVDCDQQITTSDVLVLLRFLAGVTQAAPAGCPQIGHVSGAEGVGQPAQAAGFVHGDVDCNQVVDGRDVLAALIAVSHPATANVCY